jgi:catechol 2,3-dioxygenase-like lactoylglutathione lyase family enzyme
VNLWDSTPALRLYGVCLVTGDVPRLRAFYESIFGVLGEGDDEHVVLAPEGAALTLFSTRGMERMAPGSMAGAGSGNTLLGIHLEGSAGIIDATHARLVELGIPIVKPPQTHPWGSRSLWFRDPDGNIITLAAKAAQERSPQ